MKLELNISPQPDDTTCGPTCLHAVYRYYGEAYSLDQIIREVTKLQDGGTLAVFMGCHALQRDYDASIYTYNLHVFDPTWFQLPVHALSEKLREQLLFKLDPKLHCATHGYMEFLQGGGTIRFADLTGALLRSFLTHSIPIITGLNSTFLYKCSREYVHDDKLLYDDVRGISTGHFVVLAGYDKEHRRVLIADPSIPNPVSSTPYYEVQMDHLISAIMLGIITYDANLLIVQPKHK
ncbi:peptidase-C39 like family protein [candidate division KSB1 bacterium]|nr:peptidase-C39 like family protein [candidate division KSB1 bacterium]